MSWLGGKKNGPSGFVMDHATPWGRTTCPARSGPLTVLGPHRQCTTCLVVDSKKQMTSVHVHRQEVDVCDATSTTSASNCFVWACSVAIPEQDSSFLRPIACKNMQPCGNRARIRRGLHARDDACCAHGCSVNVRPYQWMNHSPVFRGRLVHAGRRGTGTISSIRARLAAVVSPPRSHPTTCLGAAKKQEVWDGLATGLAIRLT